LPRRPGHFSPAFFPFQPQNLNSNQYKRTSVMHAYELELLGARPVNEVVPLIYTLVDARDCPLYARQTILGSLHNFGSNGDERRRRRPPSLFGARGMTTGASNSAAVGKTFAPPSKRCPAASRLKTLILVHRYTVSCDTSTLTLWKLTPHSPRWRAA